MSQWFSQRPCCPGCGGTATVRGHGLCSRCYDHTPARKAARAKAWSKKYHSNETFRDRVKRRAKDHVIANYEATYERTREWAQSNPEKVKAYRARYKHRSRYGFTVGDKVLIPLLGAAECVGKPRVVRGERICDLRLDRTQQVLESTPVEGVTRVIA